MGSQSTGKHALLDQLVVDGFRYIFGNPGTTEQAFMDALQDHPELEFILALHEGVAVSMADTYARATRKPAFVELHIAPGFGSGSGMIFNAKASNSSLVVYAGQSASRALLQDPLLSGDIVSMARPISKWAYEIHHAADVPQALRRALKVADEPPQGPVVLSIPLDVMDESADVTITPTSYTRWRVHPDPAAMDEAAALLTRSERPALVVGDGIALADAQAELVAVAELLGAPVFQGYSSEVNMPMDHPLFAGALPLYDLAAPATTAKVLARHDVVLVVGAPLFRFIFPSRGGGVPEGTTLIHIHIDGWELGKNVPGALGIRADALAALAALRERLADGGPAGAARRAAALGAEHRGKREAAIAADRRTWDASPISVARLMGELAAALPANAAIFDEATTASPTLARYVMPRPGSYYRARGGGLGPGMPGAVALKLAMPDRPVLGVVSDGAAMYTVSALWTAAHHRVPVTWVIVNNASYRILKQNLMDYLGPEHARREFVALDLVDPPLRFDRIAEAMGVHGRRVERPQDLRPALDEALALGAPALVDVVVDGRVR
ncbi:MAG TPA: thiamine pyrophosphate-binding protein [Candidatus Limnocylindria bacterium]|nr:thiamine pyrophosphate-binding protein [Candidatus Limnocylindria bacterium]